MVDNRKPPAFDPDVQRLIIRSSFLFFAAILLSFVVLIAFSGCSDFDLVGLSEPLQIKCNDYIFLDDEAVAALKWMFIAVLVSSLGLLKLYMNFDNEQIKATKLDSSIMGNIK